MKKYLKITTFTLTLLLLVAFSAYAGWTGPTTVVSGTWGEAPGEFGADDVEGSSGFPTMLALNQAGLIFVGDGTNKRIQVFNADGSFSRLIAFGFPPGYQGLMQWPLSLYACDSAVFTERNEYTQAYGFNGDLVQNFTSVSGGIVSMAGDCNFYTYNPADRLYRHYSPTGALFGAYSTVPLSMGRVTSSVTEADGSESLTVQYSDVSYSLTVPQKPEELLQNSNGALSVLVNAGSETMQQYGVYRYDRCGNLLASLSLPASNIMSDGSVEAPEYGSPVVSDNGDIYAWRRTDAGEVLRWSWTGTQGIVSLRVQDNGCRV